MNERIKRARLNLILDEPWFGTLLMQLRVAEDATRKTMSTNGRRLLYNPDYVASLDDAYLKSVLAHEVLHCALLHPFRLGSRELSLFNTAADYAINNFLDSFNRQMVAAGHPAPFPLHPDWYLDHRFDGLSAEQIYDQLRSEEPPPEPKPQGGQSPSPSGPGKQPSPSTNPGEVEAPTPDPAAAGQLEAEWKCAVKQASEAARIQGRLPTQFARQLKELLEPAVNWRDILRNFLTALSTDDYSWSRPNRRYSGSRVVLPSLHSPKLGRVAIAIDTSGSIGEKELALFCAEINSVFFDCRPSQLILLQCDARLHEYRVIEPLEDISVELKGGGGTDFRPVFEALDGQLEEKFIPDAYDPTPPVALIFLTDLAGTFPDDAPDYPVLWASIGRREAPFGTTIRIS